MWSIQLGRKKILLFPVTCTKKGDTDGRKQFFNYFFFIFYSAKAF